MAINPQQAARQNDERVNAFVKKEQDRIDKALVAEYYTNGPPIDVEPSTFDIPGVDRAIMLKYNSVGWRIEVVARGDKEFWRFHQK
jgi:hypothetical protein